MLTRYIDEQSRHVTYTSNQYILTIDGELTTTVDEEVIPFNEENKAFIEFLGKPQFVSKAFLMAITFKPVYESQSFVQNWSILFVDGNVGNTHPSNLIWKPPIGGQRCPENEQYFVVPGFSRHGVDENGEFYNRESDKILKVRPSGGYMNVTAWNDSGYYPAMGIHRIMGLALLEYDERVNDMTINHKDGDKRNNVKPNLEWATYSENNIHAMDLNLNKNRRRCKIYDHHESRESEYKSLSEAAAAINVDTSQLIAAHKSPKGLMRQRYSFKYIDDTTPWPVYSPVKLKKAVKKREAMRSTDCVAYNILTKKFTIAANAGLLARIIGLSNDDVRTALSTCYPWPTKNHICYFTNAYKRIPFFTEEMLDAFKDRSGIRRPVSITYRDGTIKIFVNGKELSEFIGEWPRFADSKLSTYRIWNCAEYELEYIEPQYK